MVVKLSGFAKFELDIKLNADQFATLINALTTDASGFSEEKFVEILEVFEKTFGENITPFAGDLENETYKSILSAIREFNASELK
jgi:hypothetical protein